MGVAREFRMKERREMEKNLVMGKVPAEAGA